MQILILGATGMLGQPVTRCLMDKGHRVRVLTRRLEKARRIFGNTAEIVEGNAVDRDSIRTALAGCDAVHINLTQESELIATQHVIEQAAGSGLERITYASATTACEDNRWFEMVDVKMRTEEILRGSGIAHAVFCPTWVMEVLHNFIHGDRAAVIMGGGRLPCTSLRRQTLGGWWPRRMMMIDRLASACSFTGRRVSHCLMR